MKELKAPGGNSGGINSANPDRKTEYISLKQRPDGFEFRGKYRTTNRRMNDEGKEQVTHYFDDAEGNPVGVNGTVKLNDILSQVAPGTWIAIKKIGMQQNKGNKYKSVNVQVFALEENEIPNADAQQATPTKKAAGGLPF